MKYTYQLLSTSLLLGDKEQESKLYVRWDSEKIYYITTDINGKNQQYFESTKHPENLTKKERYRILEYCLGTFNKDEIVNYNDLFLQNEFIVESNIPNNYYLSEEWLNF